MKKYQQWIGIGLIGFRAVLKSPQATEPISIIVVDGDWKMPDLQKIVIISRNILGLWVFILA